MAGHRKIVVTGDVLIEWRFAQSSILHARGTRPETGYYMQCTREESCSESLGRLIEGSFKASNLPAAVVYPNLTEVPIEPGNLPFWHTYMLCTPYPVRPDQGENVAKHVVWRVNRRVGIDRQPSTALKPLLTDDQEDGERADIVVVQDAYHGFNEQRHVWPSSLVSPRAGAWAVVRWKQPPEGKKPSAVWDHVSTAFKDRIVLVVSADDLRIARMRISRDLTWERAIEDLDQGLRTLWRDEYASCAYLVVSFYGAGAAVFARTSADGYTGRLYYDPQRLQETWARQRSGSMFGYTRCLTAAITVQLFKMLEGGKISKHDPQLLGEAIRPGLHAQQRLQRDGFAEEAHPEMSHVPNAVPLLHFPVDSIAQTIAREFAQEKADDALPSVFRYVERSIPPGLDAKPAQTDEYKWKILREELRGDSAVLLHAKRIVEQGTIAAMDLGYPVARFSDLIATDRTEIESYSIIASLFKNYVSVGFPRQVQQFRQPLSIAVFGGPGSGKSFGVKAVAKYVGDGDLFKALTFNLSQLSSPGAINDALHQVRDVGLTGAMPLVFWDEFDAELNGKLGWLRYFLAPMQDGTFQAGPVTHNVGRAVFVFAGGSHHSMKEFAAKAAEESGIQAKVPDFVSRLKGFVDVKGVNYRPGSAAIDPAIAIRRAVLLHTALTSCGANLEQTIVRKDSLLKQVNIDPGLVYAFLTIPEFKYAAR